MVGAKWSQSANWSNYMCCIRTSIKEKLYKELNWQDIGKSIA